MKKIIRTFTVLLFVGISFLSLSFIVKAESLTLGSLEVDSMAYAISAQMGEDASTEAGINYLSLVKGTYAMVTEASDTEFANAKKYEPEYIDPELVDENCAADVMYGYPVGVWTCEVDITGLTPNTRYAYYITDGTNKSKVCYFKTAPADNSSFSFGYLTDTQIYGTASLTNATFKSLVNATENIMAYDENGDPGINFILGGGDMTNNGGDGSFQAMFYENPNITKVSYMSTAGNHEYNPAVNSYSSFGSRWYVMHANNPENGCDELVRQESTWYVKYGDTLIVSLTSSEATASQIKWLDEVLANNPAQWIICIVHYWPNSPTTDTQARAFVPTFDKYGVDLVLYGHHHTYKVEENYYNYKKVSPSYSGTTYFQLAAAYQHGDSSTTPTAAKIDVSPEGIRIFAYDTQGRVQGTFNIAPKRNAKEVREAFDEKAFVESVSVVANQDNRTQAVVSYGGSAYENVKSLTFKNADDSVIASVKVVNDKYPNTTIQGLTADKEYNCFLEYELKDGTKKKVEFTFDTYKIYGTLDKLTFEETSKGYRASFQTNLLPEVKGLKAYLNDEFYSELKLSARLLTIPFEDFAANKKNKVEIKGVLEDGTEVLIQRYFYGEDVEVVEYTVTYDLDGGTCEGLVEKFTDPAAVALPTPVKEGYNFLGWYEGETKVEALTEAKNYELKAKWEKVETEPDPEPDPEPNPNPNPDPDPQPQPEPGGCKNATSVLFTSLMLLGVVLIRRKKW